MVACRCCLPRTGTACRGRRVHSLRLHRHSRAGTLSAKKTSLSFLCFCVFSPECSPILVLFECPLTFLLCGNQSIDSLALQRQTLDAYRGRIAALSLALRTASSALSSLTAGALLSEGGLSLRETGAVFAGWDLLIAALFLTIYIPLWQRKNVAPTASLSSGLQGGSSSEPVSEVMEYASVRQDDEATAAADDKYADSFDMAARTETADASLPLDLGRSIRDSDQSVDGSASTSVSISAAATAATTAAARAE